MDKYDTEKMNKLTAKLINETNSQLSVSEIYRARVLVSSSLSAGLLLTPFMITWGIWSGFAGVQFVLLSMLILTLLTTPYFLKLTNSISAAGIYVNCLSTIIIIVFTFFDGGLYSTAIPWFPVLPLFAVFYSGKKYGFAIALIFTTYLFVLLAMHMADLVPPLRLMECPSSYFMPAAR
jgi:hypothetical protein